MNSKPTCLVLLLLLGQGASLFAQPEPGTILWTFDAANLITSSPAVTPEGRVYFGASGALYAITNYGSNARSFASGTSSDGSPAVAKDGTVYYSSDALYAINPDGSQQWRYDSQGGASSPAIGLDGTIYVTGGAYLHAVAPTGTNKWRYNFLYGVGTRFHSPAVSPNGKIHVCWFNSHTFYAISPTGIQLWSYPLTTVPADSPAVGSDGKVYFTGAPLYSFSPEGTNLWTSQTNLFTGSSPAIGRNGEIYVANAYGSLCAFDESGNFKWQVLTNGPRAGTVPVVDSAGTIYYLAYSVLYAIDPEGSVKWSLALIRDPADQFGTSRTSPAIGPDGTIYATSANRLYAIVATNKLADSSWPMCRQNARHTGKIEKPSLQQPKKRSDGNFQFQLYSQLGQTNALEATSNLSTWTSLTDIVVTNVPMDVVDLSASNFISRFYRVLSP